MARSGPGAFALPPHTHTHTRARDVDVCIWIPTCVYCAAPQYNHHHTLAHSVGHGTPIHVRSQYSEGSLSCFSFPFSGYVCDDPSPVRSTSQPTPVSRFSVIDAWHGVPLTGKTTAAGLEITAPVDSSLLGKAGGCAGTSSDCAGFGAVLLTRTPRSATLESYLERMRGLTARPLASYSCEGGTNCPDPAAGTPRAWPFYAECTATQCAGLTIREVPIAPTPQHAVAPGGAGARMIRIAGGKNFKFATTGVMIEGSTAQGVDVQFPWEPTPRKDHVGTVDVGSMWVDKYPVTNARWAAFVADASYTPQDVEHYLQHWAGGTEPPAGWANKPVTYVALTDARAFCGHYALRLPNVQEWQWLAGQHADQSQQYPWGGDAPSNATAGGTGPAPGHDYGGPRDVDALPAGCTPAGVCDLVGNAWEMSAEFQDQHTRSVVLLGGSNYRPSGSNWYLPQAWQISQHEKYMLYSDGYERAATIGFRCVADAV